MLNQEGYEDPLTRLILKKRLELTDVLMSGLRFIIKNQSCQDLMAGSH